MSELHKPKVFIGYDSREDLAWQVCRHSLLRHSDGAVDAIALRQDELREEGLYTRPYDLGASTEFSLTRFLTPYVANRPGWVVFCDCDFLFNSDLRLVFEGLDPSKALYCVQHSYTPAYRTKMDGKPQAIYPRKNWSSFMVLNCDHPDVKALTPDVVNRATASYLHRFEWISDDKDIGALHLDWNFLAGEYPLPDHVPHAIHYTNGGPWFEQWKDCDFGGLWSRELDLYLQSLEPSQAPLRAYG